MNELETIVRAVRALRAAREPFVVATVVRVRGSAYRRPGARLILAEGRRLAGSVSGGCLEADLLRRGFFRTERAPVLATYDGRADDEMRESFGVGCDGIVEVLLQRGSIDPGPDDPFLALEAVLADETSRVLATVFSSRAGGAPLGTQRVIDPADAHSAVDEANEIVQSLVHSLAPLAERVRATGQSACFADERHDVVVERLTPPPQLFVFGTGHDVVPVVGLARGAGFRVTVCDHETRLATHERFGSQARVLSGPWAAAVAELDRAACAGAIVMGHHIERDASALRALLGSRARYLGVLGPRVRTARLLGGESLLNDPRLFAPAGLRLGGETPEAVALAMVAEAQAVLGRRTGGHHRDHHGAIHEG
jgi:xanthine/CO dehydrogenase XdhC/CoxF family maturation factor